MGMKKIIIIATAAIVACTIAVVIAITINTKALGEQQFQNCVANAGGYQSHSLDEKIRIRDTCGSYLR
jgi:hypothetical protein